MIRVRDNKTKPFKTMYPHSLPCPKISDKKRYCFRNTKLKPEEKLSAVKRIRNGESKASVARAINVPESTLRGWCKNLDKIQTTVDRELFMRSTSSDGSTSSTSLDSFEKSPHQLASGLTQPTSTAFTHPKCTAFNASQQYRPWTPNPDPPSNSPHSRSPASPKSQVVCSAAETQELQSLMSWQYAKMERSVGMEVNSPTPIAGDVALDLRLPADLSIRPSPMIKLVDSRNSTSNTTVATTAVENVQESGSGPIVGKTEEHRKDDKSKKNTKKDDCDNIIDPVSAYRNAQIFFNWFQTYSDPTLTAQDFLRFQDLLGRVKEIAQRVQHTEYHTL